MTFDADKCAFDAYLENTRLEIFQMYEDLRAVARDSSTPWCERLSRLNAVAAGAQQVWSTIAELNAAIWLDCDETGNAIAPTEEAPARVPALAGSR